MPIHNISDPVFQRLQSHAIPLVDTIDAVIARALDALEGTPVLVDKDASGAELNDAKVFDPAAPPSLTHTVPRTILVDGKPIEKDVYWNTLLFEVVRASGEQGISAEKILAVFQTPAKIGNFNGPGYRYVPEAGISFQQLNSDRAWTESHRLASKFGISVVVRWIWQKKEKAHMPGVTGTMKVN